jgi:hypothetical protein
MVKGEAMNSDELWESETEFELDYLYLLVKSLLLDKVKVVPKLDRGKLSYQIVVDKIELE